MTTSPRSQGTRDRILDQARRLFAEHGFERTTIRMVAAEAGVNVSLVMRYYGSKEALFATAVEFRMPVLDLAGIAPAERGRTLVRQFLERWEGEEAGGELQALMRAAASHEVARARAIELIMRQAGRSLRPAIPDDRFETCLGLIITQLSGLAFSRYLLRHPLVTALDREVVIQRVGATIQRYLDGTSED